MAQDVDGDAHARLVAQLYDVAERILAELAIHEPAVGASMSSDLQDTANLMLARRTYELAIAATDDFHFGRPLAGAVVGRSILETALALRWCLCSPANAERWWRGGEAAIQKSLRALGLSTDPAVVALRGAPTIGGGLPGFPETAVVGGLTGPYSRWYSVFSAYSHPIRMAMVHAYRVKGAQGGPSPIIEPCIYFANDVGTVFSTWARRREVPAAWPHP